MNKKIILGVYNLYNGDYTDIEVLGLKEFREKAFLFSKGHDYEVQEIVTNNNLKLESLMDYLAVVDYVQENELDIDNDTIIALTKGYYKHEIIEIFENDTFYTFIEAEDKEDAIAIYCHDFLNMIPEHLECYIDYSKLLRDMQFNGLRIYRTKRVKDSKSEYIIID